LARGLVCWAGFGLSLAVLLALISYDLSDPSLNSWTMTDTASHGTHNWLGMGGALFADLAWQGLGAVGLLLPLYGLRQSYGPCRLAWLGWAGVRGMVARPDHRRQLFGSYGLYVWARGVLLLLTLSSLCLVADQLQQLGAAFFGERAVWGGMFGQYLHHRYQQTGWAMLPLPLMFGLLGCWLLFTSYRVHWAAWWGGVQNVISRLSPRYWFSCWQVHRARTHMAPAARFAPALMPMRPHVARQELAEDSGGEDAIPPPPSFSAAAADRAFGGGAFAAVEDEDDVAPPKTAQRTAVILPLMAPQAAKAAKAAASDFPKKAATSAAAGDEVSGARSTIPPLNLLKQPPAKMVATFDRRDLEQKAADLLVALADYGVKAQIHNIHPGPVVTLFEVEPAAGVKASRVISLADDLARAMRAVSVRVFVLAGTNLMGVEVPNANRETIYLREVLSHQVFQEYAGKLPLVLGKDIGGAGVVADLARMPHLLVAGTTGSGKSVGLNSMILSLLYKLSPEQVRFIMIDPKMLELSVYDGIPHLLTPVVTDPKKAIVALKWTVKEMENRYRQMANLGVRNIEGYNQRLREARERGEILKKRVQTGYDPETGKPSFEDQALDLNELPLIVVVVDEMADLMLVAGKEIEAAIQRLAQMARAAGIHIIMATQRPSVDVITGTIKANFPTRISFQVTSKIDSRTILGQMGAEQLLGQGDMLYMSTGGKLIRVHGPFVSDGEVESIANFLRALGEPNYLMGVTDDEDGEVGLGEKGGRGGGDDANGGDLYNQAINVILSEKKISTSLLQRHLQIGYNRAAKLMDELEREGVVSAPGHSGKRQILIGDG
jgi:S-DNA-T family DNA segregation ATPase FtsK/SpoIIIE